MPKAILAAIHRQKSDILSEKKYFVFFLSRTFSTSIRERRETAVVSARLALSIIIIKQDENSSPHHFHFVGETPQDNLIFLITPQMHHAFEVTLIVHLTGPVVKDTWESAFWPPMSNPGPPFDGPRGLGPLARATICLGRSLSDLQRRRGRDFEGEEDPMRLNLRRRCCAF